MRLKAFSICSILFLFTFFTGKGQDPHGSMINICTETAPMMVPVRHVQPVAQGSKDVRTQHFGLSGGGKSEENKKERLAAAVQALSDHLKGVGVMFWLPPFRTQQDPRKS